MIKPTIGRVVWFTPSVNNDPRNDKTQPLAALIVRVWGDNCINVVAFTPEGAPIPGLTSVRLLQDDEVPNPAGYYAEWMPYQVGQAKAAEKTA